MSEFPAPLDLSKVKVSSLSERKSLSSLDDILLDGSTPAPACPPEVQRHLTDCVQAIRSARERGASVMLIYGAHLVKNGLLGIANELVNRGWITHLATNGAGTIHDWELSFFGRTEENVRENVKTGSFGTWDETGRNLNLAILTGGLRNEGYGRALGRFIQEDGCTLPTTSQLEHWLRAEPGHPLSPARAELLRAMLTAQISSGRVLVPHPHKDHSILANAYRQNIPITVHPGIGYDIIVTHPMFSGAGIGRAAQVDFGLFSRSVEGLDAGVVLSVGSAIMAPQVFEKSLSCVNNLRLHSGRPIVQGHQFYVVDIQDGGNWDWSQGEPPKDNPAYYLRFCKSFARMDGTMHYVQADNTVFLCQLLSQLKA
jgi:tetrahydromethanopterin S-methyltransferase subunit F